MARRNAQIFNQLLYIRQNIEATKVNQYNEAVADYNDAIASFNVFIRYRNKQFTPMRPDTEIQALLDSASGPIQQGKKEKLSQIKNPGANIQNLMEPMQKQMNDFSDQLEEQEAVAKYFSKGKSGRKSMFTKVTWFGIPVN